MRKFVSRFCKSVRVSATLCTGVRVDVINKINTVFIQLMKLLINYSVPVVTTPVVLVRVVVVYPVLEPVLTNCSSSWPPQTLLPVASTHHDEYARQKIR